MEEEKNASVSNETMDNTASNEVTDTMYYTMDDLCQKQRRYKKEEEKEEQEGKKEKKQPDNINFNRAVIIKDTIRQCLYYGEKDPKAILGYMSTRYEEVGFQNTQQKRINLFADFHRVFRYIHSETRKPVYIQPKKSTFGTQKPDFMFVNGDQIELGFWKIGRPEFTKRGTSKRAIIRDLSLYALVRYARELGFKYITASYYYLTKTSDVDNWNQCIQSFFGTGDNVLSMTDIWGGKPNDLDAQMADKIDILKNGVKDEEMPEDECEYCKYYNICRYTNPPITIDAVQQAKAKTAITPSDDQKKVIDFGKGVCVVNAGAGSGKTSTIVERVVKLLKDGVKPEKTFMSTYTNAAAVEMRGRIEARLQGDPAAADLDKMLIMTFHAFQFEIAKHFWKELGYKRELSVMLDAENYALIANIIDDNPIYEWSGASFKSFDKIGRNQWGFKGAVQIAAMVFDAVRKLNMPTSSISTVDVREQTGLSEAVINSIALEKLIKLFDIYMGKLKETGNVTFDDQVILAEKVLNEIDPDYIKNHYGFQHVIIDEFQDSNPEQIWLINKMIDTPEFVSLTLVGDDAQAIFAFQDTSPEYILNADQYFPGHDITHIELVENRRSTQEILDFAQKPLDRNTSDSGKRLVSTRGHGDPVVTKVFFSMKEEYVYIMKSIKAMIDAGKNPSDIAFLAATKSELNAAADAATKLGIPSAFYAPQPIMENSRVNAVLAFARYLKDTTDTQDLMIVANALLKADNLESEGIMDLPEEEREVYEKKVSGAAYVINTTDDLAAKKQIFLQTVNSFSLDDEAVESFTDSLSNKDFDEILTYCGYFEKYGGTTEVRRKKKSEGVALSTIHSAKGLEWDTVFVSLSGVFKEKMSKASMEEARRLIFVAGTRARDHLIMTGCYEARFSSKTNVVMNPFVREMMEDAGEGGSFDTVFSSIMQKKSFSGSYVARRS